MVSRRLLFVLLATSCHAQYQVGSDLRADMTFNAANDRFDVGNIIDEQKRVYNDLPTQMEEGRRRSFRPLAELLKQHRRQYQRDNEKSLRRMDSDFAYHDLMLDENDYVEGQFDKNLAPFRIQTPKASRRSPHFMFNKVSLRLNPDDNDENKPKEKKKNTSIMKNLQNIVLKYLHGGKAERRGRRSDTSPEDEILLHYAVPLRKSGGSLKCLRAS